MRGAGLLVIATLGLSACGGAAVDPLLGVWEVGAHTRNDAGCAAEGPAVTDPPYVQFQASDVEGQQVVERVDCTGPAMCEASHGLAGLLYTEQLEGGLRAEVFTAFGDPTACALAARRSDALIAADGTLRVETRRYEQRDVSGVVCDGATAERMLSSLTCLELDVFTAQRPLD